MIVGIKIMPREVILDTQGRAIENSMKSNGFAVDSIRAGKYLEVTLRSESEVSAKKEITQMLDSGGLYNPLIEKFEIIFS